MTSRRPTSVTIDPVVLPLPALLAGAFYDLERDSLSNPFHDRRRGYGAESVSFVPRGSYYAKIRESRTRDKLGVFHELIVRPITYAARPWAKGDGSWIIPVIQPDPAVDVGLLPTSLEFADHWLAAHVLTQGKRRTHPTKAAEVLHLHSTLTAIEALDALIAEDPTIIAKILAMPSPYPDDESDAESEPRE
jgi:hypothetical protein